MLKRSDLLPYQNAGVDFIKSTARGALWWDMGLGKTTTTTTALVDLFDDFEVFRVLIVGPLRVVRKTWPDELRAWEHTRKLSFTVIDGNSVKKKEALACRDTAIHLISRESLKWLIEFWRGAAPYDMVVFDEASSFRNPTSNRWKAALVLSSRVKRVVELTGTPAPNGLHQVWSQIALLDHGKRLGRGYKDFRERWFDYNPFSQKIIAKGHSEGVIHEKLKDICFTLKSEDYLDLPEITYRTVTLDLEPAQKAQYEKLEKDAVLEMSGSEVVAFSAGALAVKLLQFANGAVYTDEKRSYAVFHDAKIAALQDIVDDANGEPILVAYNYQSDLERLRKAFPGGSKIDTDDSIAAWNAGLLDIAFAHPQSAGLGLNLQAGGRVIVWFGLTWDLELYQQFNKRLHRKGQERPVIIHHLVAAGTIDESVIYAIPQKAATQDRLLDAMKRLIERVAKKT